VRLFRTEAVQQRRSRTNFLVCKSESKHGVWKVRKEGVASVSSGNPRTFTNRGESSALSCLLYRFATNYVSLITEVSLEQEGGLTSMFQTVWAGKRQAEFTCSADVQIKREE